MIAFDYTISIPLLLTIVGLAVTGLWRLFSLSEKAEAALKTAVDTKDKLADLKLELAQNYPNHGQLKDLEDRISKAIDGLAIEIRQLRAYIMDK